MTGSAVCGVFVGGASRRMGGAPKGLLVAPGGGSGEVLVARLARVAREAGCEPVLVGDGSTYAGVAPGVPCWPDSPPGVGPLGGLRALLAGALGHGARHAVALACDMPYVTPDALRYLLGYSSSAAVVCARRSADAPLEPMFARYDPARALEAVDRALARGDRSLQAALREAGAAPFELPPVWADALRDWDTPADVRAGRG